MIRYLNIIIFRYEKYIGWDIGIKNLSYCIIDETLIF